MFWNAHIPKQDFQSSNVTEAIIFFKQNELIKQILKVLFLSIPVDQSSLVIWSIFFKPNDSVKHQWNNGECCNGECQPNVSGHFTLSQLEEIVLFLNSEIHIADVLYWCLVRFQRRDHYLVELLSLQVVSTMLFSFLFVRFCTVEYVQKCLRLSFSDVIVDQKSSTGDGNWKDCSRVLLTSQRESS